MVVLEGEELGQRYLAPNLASFREGSGQECPKPASVYEEFDESGRSERCV
jgi:hypothetical protein